MITFSDAYHREGEKFPGFLVYSNLIVSPLKLSSWNAQEIHYPMRVTSINDIPVSNYSDLMDLTMTLPAGQEVPFTFDVSGTTVSYLSRIALFQKRDLLALYGVFLVSAFVFFLCGLILWFSKSQDESARLLFFFCLLAACTVLLVFDMSSTHRFWRLHLGLIPILSASLVHLSFYFPTPRSFLKMHPSAQWYPYLFSIFMMLLLQSFFYEAREFWLLVDQFNMALLFLAGLIFVLTMGVLYRELETVTGKLQAKALLIGGSMPFGIPILVWILGKTGDLHASLNLAMLSIAAFPMSIFYTIVKHDLFGLGGTVKKIAALTFLTVAFSLGYLAIVLITGQRLGFSEEFQNPLLILIPFGLLAIFVGLFYGWETSFFKRALFSRSEKYRLLIEGLSSLLSQFLDKEQIIKIFQ
ncbi:MAG: hypothetical protein HY538_07560, partial [Deltaproteobacteria bacterium]|nr:hypothetical protein [Deltaproteobacteria bacterium]